jgi:effector-binding domain-containing protein
LSEVQTKPELTTIPEAATAVIRAVVPLSDLPSFFDRAFPTIGAALGASGATSTGPAFAYYLREPDDSCELEVGFPVDGVIQPTGDAVASRLPGGRVATVVHQGGYDGLQKSWTRLQEWVQEQGLTPVGGFWEVYLTEPSPDGDPADNRTALYLPLQG